MDSSPPLSPSILRYDSPLPDEDELLAPTSPSPSPVPSPSPSLSRPAHDLYTTTPNSADAQARVESGHDLPQVSAKHPLRDAGSRLLKGKERARLGPLRLLDLPVDVLKEIIQQLPHTNDLTSLALCHSALHRLAIPYIYSRFDIVWPDESTHTEPRSGVDALTYGLATLVTGEDCFPHQVRTQREPNTSSKPSRRSAPTPYPIPRRRFGNYYAQFTKKFSLGNGPAAWVQEYMITKEGGKMLGTLVALAIARMINLETFVWDMPTGVLRDVWLALSSQAGRTDGEDCRLDRLWIRWHDNTIDAPVPPPAPPLILNTAPPPGTTHPSGVGMVQPPVVLPQTFHTSSASAMDRVEYPTFSVIPPLRSLSVLDIDELPYLDEMSILIARSQHKLRELRVGIAPHAQQRDWATAWEGERIQQVDYDASWIGASSIGEKRLGGVLGILVGRVHNLRHSESQTLQHPSRATQSSRQTEATVTKIDTADVQHSLSLAQHDRDLDHGNDEMENVLAAPTVSEGVSLIDGVQSLNIDPAAHPANLVPPNDDEPSQEEPSLQPSTRFRNHVNFLLNRETDEPAGPKLTGKLKLETLELERVPLSVPVLLRAFDWTIMTTLTLLNCHNHEQLWKSLRRTYTPRSAYMANSPSSSKAYKASYTLRSEYSLNLKRIHTNTVSPSLISFLKETLAPNTLEVLFLQEGRSYQSTVTVEAIYRGPLRRHRASLKKLMIDSSEKGLDGHTTNSLRWRRWMLNRDILSFITSGRMSSLRELAVAIDYKDWHHFLQRLPLIPHIRSLYIPFIADHPHGNNIDPRELAYQILDIVHLRPEVELCYMGLSTKCFEILENRLSNYDLRHDGINAGDGVSAGYIAHDPMISDDESEVTEDEDEEELDGGISAEGGEDDTESEGSEEIHDDSDDESFIQDNQKGPKLRVREILFYEERVEAFRRRHGVLRP